MRKKVNEKTCATKQGNINNSLRAASNLITDFSRKQGERERK